MAPRYNHHVRSPIPARWVAITVFIFASVLNYLDRQILATMVDIWRAHPEFPFTYDDYGLLLSVFSIAYALSALFVGWFIDRVGLNRGAGLRRGACGLSRASAPAHRTAFINCCCGAPCSEFPKPARSPPSPKPSRCTCCRPNAPWDKP